MGTSASLDSLEAPVPAKGRRANPPKRITGRSKSRRKIRQQTSPRLSPLLPIPKVTLRRHQCQFPALPKEQDGNGIPIRRTRAEVLGDQTVGRALILRGEAGTRMDTGTSTKVIRARG